MNRTKGSFYLMAGVWRFLTNILVLDLLFMEEVLFVGLSRKGFSIGRTPPPKVLTTDIIAAGGTGGLLSSL